MMTNAGTAAQEALYDLAESKHSPTDALRDLVWLREQLERGIGEQVVALRADGASWAAVGMVLGISAQGAHKRWGGTA